MDEKIEQPLANVISYPDSLVHCNICVKVSIKLLIKCNILKKTLFICVEKVTDFIVLKLFVQK